jgi:polyisoprenoid-binding protein YceI
MHSIVEFAVKHLVVTTVKGRFRELEGKIEIDEADPENSSVEAKIAVASVDTNVEARDNDLRSDNFFNSEKVLEASGVAVGDTVKMITLHVEAIRQG